MWWVCTGWQHSNQFQNKVQQFVFLWTFSVNPWQKPSILQIHLLWNVQAASGHLWKVSLIKYALFHHPQQPYIHILPITFSGKNKSVVWYQQWVYFLWQYFLSEPVWVGPDWAGLWCVRSLYTDVDMLGVWSWQPPVTGPNYHKIYEN